MRIRQASATQEAYPPAVLDFLRRKHITRLVLAPNRRGDKNPLKQWITRHDWPLPLVESEIENLVVTGLELVGADVGTGVDQARETHAALIVRKVLRIVAVIKVSLSVEVATLRQHSSGFAMPHASRRTAITILSKNVYNCIYILCEYVNP